MTRISPLPPPPSGRPRSSYPPAQSGAGVRTAHARSLSPETEGDDFEGDIDSTMIRAAKRSEGRCRAILGITSDAILVLSEAEQILRSSPRTVDLFGYTQEELLALNPMALFAEGSGWKGMFTPQTAAETPEKSAVPQRQTTYQGRQLYGRRKTGDEFPIELSFAYAEGEAGALTFVAIRDLSLDFAAAAAEEVAEEARRLARGRTVFLSNVSHELRTPMNAILGFAQILELAVDLTPRHRERVRNILDAGRHLLDLINDVLDVTRIEAGTISITIEPVRLDDVINEVAQMLQPDAARRSITLRANAGSARGLWVAADRQRLKQVLTNLVSNAVKYNRDGGSVDVRCNEMMGGRTRISVSDTGVGLSADDIKRLFQPFERLGAERTGVPGTGLGLSLSKQLVSVMGGEVHVVSELGVGSTFSFDLVSHIPTKSERRTSDTLAVRAAASRARRYPTILVIESDSFNRQMVEDVLSTCYSARLLVTATVREGLIMARESRPSLVVLDGNALDMSVEDALRELRAGEGGAALPVVVSVDPATTPIERILGAGASACITKPFLVPELLDTIDDFLKTPQKVS